MNAVGKESASYFYEAKRVQEELAVPYYQDLHVTFKAIAKDYLLGRITIDQAMEQFKEKRAQIYGNQP
jgi:hypothetical protein